MRQVSDLRWLGRFIGLCFVHDLVNRNEIMGALKRIQLLVIREHGVEPELNVGDTLAEMEGDLILGIDSEEMFDILSEKVTQLLMRRIYSTRGLQMVSAEKISRLVEGLLHRRDARLTFRSPGEKTVTVEGTLFALMDRVLLVETNQGDMSYPIEDLTDIVV